MIAPSPNFSFLAYFGTPLVEAAARAEGVLSIDPIGALTHLRRFGELLARAAAARLGVPDTADQHQSDRLRQLDSKRVPWNVIQMFHSLRMAGNRATHEGQGTQQEAFDQLRIARELAIWFQRAFGNDRKFQPGPLVPPPDLKAETETMAIELARLRAESTARETELEQARAAVDAEAQKSLGVAEAERKAREERELWETLAAEAEAARNADRRSLEEAQRALAQLQKQYELDLAALQAKAEQAPAQAQSDVVEQAIAAAAAVDLDEAATRAIIDQQLRAVGWEVDTHALRFGNGARPQKGKLLAIAEWPTAEGPADYVLFDGLTALAVVEAKKVRKDVSAAVKQAKRYSRGFRASEGAEFAGGPWGDYRVPFVYASNGRPYLRQLEAKSGIWFCDVRRPQNLAKPLLGWHSPEGLRGLLKQNIDQANARLVSEPTDYLGLRDYQVAAIRAVEQAIAKDQRAILLAMATGTGKTRTAIGLVYRLLKAQRFRRILFLVDRTTLGQQASDAFNEVHVENLQTFTNIFDLKGLDDIKPDIDTKLHIATVQGMVRRIVGADGPESVPPVDNYDCIVIDECHRGYGLDQEMSDGELKLSEFGIRNQADYISKYRRVLDHFDCTKIGLTATPALHTTEIFGPPTYSYTYREAVIDGCLIDHEPPLSLVTQLAESGIHWDKGAQVPLFDPGQVGDNFVQLEDEVNIEIDSFNRTVVTQNFNKAVCRELARHIDPKQLGKTLIFCATDLHADIVVDQLKHAFQEQYGEVDDDAVVKITGAADKPQKLLRLFRNEQLPNVAVTVDLLTTGVDIPRITNLVFLRRVRSRILYEQMLGRATRRCDEIEKETFRIFDAVALYEALESVNQMKPVVSNSHITFTQLYKELTTVTDADARQVALDQFIAKLQRKKVRLKGEALDRFWGIAEMSPSDLAQHLKRSTPADAAQWFKAHSLLLSVLEGSTGDRPLLISDHEDQLLRLERGYGKGHKPEDYLEAFEKYVREQINRVPALLAVAQRPRTLTRKQLKEVAMLLDQAGFNETALQVAWRDQTNEDIAASIIGFIRKAAIGDPLVSYDERVERALKKTLAKRAWTTPQRTWLTRIAKQLKQQKVLDRDAFDEGQFASEGGFARLNKQFEGQLETLLGELADEIWAKPA